jgi:hypothetical protein
MGQRTPHRVAYNISVSTHYKGRLRFSKHIFQVQAKHDQTRTLGSAVSPRPGAVEHEGGAMHALGRAGDAAMPRESAP